MRRSQRILRALMGMAISAAVFDAALASESAATSEANAEAEFRSGVLASEIGSFIKDMTAHPDFPGSPWDKRNAEKTLALFQSWGWDAHIETFPISFPLPVERLVELTSPRAFTAKLKEPPVSGDPYSEQQTEQLPSYFVYGPDGDVTSKLVYANFGLREDYDTLARYGVSMKDAIVIIRSGRMWRGGKVELAAEHGAKAVLIYTDPQEDGYYRGPTYPEGGWRSADSVQRGSILNGVFGGDPLKPFDGQKAGAEVAPGTSGTAMARIPAMPISSADALPLLAALKGPTAPENWRGALPLTYRMGSGSAIAHLRIRYRWEKIDLYDVIATLRGSTYPDEWIVRANHRDGWVYGAQDPHSGHSAMLEEARLLGELSRKGWQPKRTVIYASWDAEEQGVIGSTSWLEAHLDELRKRAVVYINTDTTGPGTLRLAGAASYSDFLTSVAGQVADPNSGASALDRVQIKARVLGSAAGARGSDALGLGGPLNYFDFKNNRLRLAPPGYGSDHQSFVSLAGIPSLLLEFGDQINLGSYHSIYDNYAWYERFGDPGFKYGAATAQFNGTAVLRLADADLLPQKFAATADALDTEVQDLTALYDKARKQTSSDNQLLDIDAPHILNDLANPRLPPIRQAVQELDLAPIQTALAAVHAAADNLSRAQLSKSQVLSTERVERINRSLMEVERAFLRSNGLPNRPFYKNEFYSPGRLWDTVPVPAVGDAILDGKWDDARQQIPLVAGTLLAIAQAMDKATAEIAGR